MARLCFWSLISLFLAGVCFAEDMPIRIRVEPVESVSISTVTSSSVQILIPPLRGRKEILIRNISTGNVNALIAVSPNSVTINDCWEVPPNNYIKLSVSSDVDVYVSSSSVINLKVIQVK